MHKTHYQQLSEERAYLEHLQGRHNTSARHLERVEEQQEVVDLLEDTIRKVEETLVINSNPDDNN